MSVIFHDKHTDTFLIGIGTNLYLYTNKSIKLLSKCGEVPEPKEKNEEVAKKKNDGPAYITGVATSKDYVAVISNNKTLELFDRDNARCACVQAVKRPTSVQLTDYNIIISDKAGDVYSYNLELEQHTYLLGHVSVVMDTVMTHDNRYLITCDRDEKIRISHYPNCYNIHSYLLGHTEYVYKILQLTQNTVLSLAGDCTLIHWDITTQTPLQTLPSRHGDYTAVTFYTPYLIACNSSHVTVYRLESSNSDSSKQLQSDSSKQLQSDSSKQLQSDSTQLTQVWETCLAQDIISIAVSSSAVVLLTNKPELISYDFVEGVLCNESVISDSDIIDLSELVPATLPDKKMADSTGFRDYFERKKRRIEEETLKEELKVVRVS